jgi:hypothetical protein
VPFAQERLSRGARQNPSNSSNGLLLLLSSFDTKEKKTYPKLADNFPFSNPPFPDILHQ